MTVADFRRMALALPEAVESTHMDHPDFLVRGKIFATFGYPETGWGMVKLASSRGSRGQATDCTDGTDLKDKAGATSSTQGAPPSRGGLAFSQA